jgi:hypothetical protein
MWAPLTFLEGDAVVEVLWGYEGNLRLVLTVAALGVVFLVRGTVLELISPTGSRRCGGIGTPRSLQEGSSAPRETSDPGLTDRTMTVEVPFSLTGASFLEMMPAGGALRRGGVHLPLRCCHASEAWRNGVSVMDEINLLDSRRMAVLYGGMTASMASLSRSVR